MAEMSEAEPEARPQDTEIPEPEPRPQDTEVPEPVPAEEPEPQPPVSLHVLIDMEAGEATIALDEGGDSVTLAREEGRWVLKPS